MKWERADYDTDPVTLAKKLIGAVLCSRTKEGLTTGRIVECEAYGGCWRGHEDDGAHSAKGITARTKVIFGEPGHAYVYLIYGMYTCLNIVCESEGIPGCVLIRAVEPLSGVELMQHRRKGAKDRLLARGPGRLTMAMGIDRSFYGEDLTGDRLWIEKEKGRYPVTRTKRIGIDYAKYGKHFPWRFVLTGTLYASG